MFGEMATIKLYRNFKYSKVIFLSRGRIVSKNHIFLFCMAPTIFLHKKMIGKKYWQRYLYCEMLSTLCFKSDWFKKNIFYEICIFNSPLMMMMMGNRIVVLRLNKRKKLHRNFTLGCVRFHVMYFKRAET